MTTQSTIDKLIEMRLTSMSDAFLTQLQDETTPLADSVKLYAEAAGLIHYCNTALDKARLQVEEIDASLAPDVEVPHDA